MILVAVRRTVSVLCVAALVMLSAQTAWSSNTPVAGAFHGCATAGKPAQNTNKLKNRATQVASPNASSIPELTSLPTTGPKVAQLAAEGVRVEGYLAMRVQERKESCNCGDPTLHDFHIWMVDQSGQARASAAVVEMTPRWRAGNPGWTLSALRHLINQKSRVGSRAGRNSPPITRTRSVTPAPAAGRSIRLRRSKSRTPAAGPSYEFAGRESGSPRGERRGARCRSNTVELASCEF